MDYSANQKRNMIVFAALFIFFAVLLISSVYMEVKSAGKKQNLANELMRFKSYVEKKVSPFFSSEPTVPASLEAKPVIDYSNTSPTPSPSPTTKPTIYKEPTATPTTTNDYFTIEYTFPTFPPQPTIAPGQPGSAEWEAEFNRKWEESKKSYEDGLKDLCQKIPDASICK